MQSTELDIGSSKQLQLPRYVYTGLQIMCLLISDFCSREGHKIAGCNH